MVGGVVGCLFVWEKELWGECCAVLTNIELQVHTPYELVWLPNFEVGYLINGAYILTQLTSTKLSAHCDLIWNKFIPSKVSTFV
jgi:hypothetical protein